MKEVEVYVKGKKELIKEGWFEYPDPNIALLVRECDEGVKVFAYRGELYIAEYEYNIEDAGRYVDFRKTAGKDWSEITSMGREWYKHIKVVYMIGNREVTGSEIYATKEKIWEKVILKGSCMALCVKEAVED